MRLGISFRTLHPKNDINFMKCITISKIQNNFTLVIKLCKKCFRVKMVFIFVYMTLLLIDQSYQQSLTNTVHKTQAAAEKINDLWCYSCDTMDDGELCIDLLTNHSTLMKKCKADEFVCMVKRFSYTTSTENSTSGPKMWSLERKCAVNCESGCIVIGERTKLSACTSCCENSLCNIGTGKGNKLFNFDSTRMQYLALVHSYSIVLYSAQLFKN